MCSLGRCVPWTGFGAPLSPRPSIQQQYSPSATSTVYTTTAVSPPSVSYRLLGEQKIGPKISGAFAKYLKTIAEWQKRNKGKKGLVIQIGNNNNNDNNTTKKKKKRRKTRGKNYKK